MLLLNMVGKRSQKVVSFNMSRIRSQGTRLESALEIILKSIPYEYIKQPKLFGKPDFAFSQYKIAIFADSEFWHGYDWENKKLELKTNKEFWLKKIERNIQRDREVTAVLEQEGWKVVRLWGHDIVKQPEKVRLILIRALEAALQK